MLKFQRRGSGLGSILVFGSLSKWKDLFSCSEDSGLDERSSASFYQSVSQSEEEVKVGTTIELT